MLHDKQKFSVPFKMISGPKICKKGRCGRGECVLTSTPPFYECKCKLPFQPPDCRTCEDNYHFISHQRNQWPLSFLSSCLNLQHCRVSAACQIINATKITQIAWIGSSCVNHFTGHVKTSHTLTMKKIRFSRYSRLLYCSIYCRSTAHRLYEKVAISSTAFKMGEWWPLT